MNCFLMNRILEDHFKNFSYFGRIKMFSISGIPFGGNSAGQNIISRESNVVIVLEF